MAEEVWGEEKREVEGGAAADVGVERKEDGTWLDTDVSDEVEREDGI